MTMNITPGYTTGTCKMCRPIICSLSSSGDLRTVSEFFLGRGTVAIYFRPPIPLENQFHIYTILKYHNGPGSKCMAQVVEAICQQWHERLR